MSPMGMLSNVPGAGPSGPPELSSLVGPTAAAATQQVAPGLNEQAQAVMIQIRDLQASVDALARQFPVAAPDADLVKQALTKLMVHVVQSMSGPEPQAAPSVIG